MDTSLLSTKFNIPPLNEKLVARPRLLAKIDVGLCDDRLLTLVCAPAGYGKTTLVSEWLNQLKTMPDSASTGQRLAKSTWLTLEESDNDLGRFLAYLIAAIGQFQPGAGQGILASLQTPRPPAPTQLATWLINDLAEVSDRFVLVLDDYHKISAQSIHDFLAFLIDHQPILMSLVIVSRADPPLALARLRARGQMVELRQEDLSFTLEETRKYLSSSMGLEITAEQLATLEARTEGWIAGLQLAALSMRNNSDIHAFIEDFSGGHVHIADFLMDEVLAQQPEMVKDFLLHTSILERLSGPLCEAVSGQTGAQEILEKLKEENLFLFSLDYQQEWYRYHALFADLLCKRLHNTRGEQVDELNQRASKWFEAQKQIIPAVEHALAGHDYQRAARLIEEIGETVLKRGESYTLLRWLEALPEEYQQTYPLLCIYFGLVLLMSGKSPDAAQSHLETLASTDGLEGLRGEMDTFGGLLAIMQGNVPETKRLSEQALHHLGPEKTFFRSLAADSLGMAYTLIGDSAAAVKAFVQAVEISEQSGNLMLMLGALSNLAGLQTLQGELRSAHTTYKRVVDISSERLGNRFSLAGKAFLGLGMLAREWNQLDVALEYYEKAKEMLASSVEIGLPIIHLSIAYVKLNQGDIEGGQAQLEKARQYAQASTLTPLDDILVEETRARFWVALGKLDQAEEWLRAQGAFEDLFIQALDSEDSRTLAGVMAKQTNYFTLVRFYLAKQQPANALVILEPLRNIFEHKGQMRKVIEILALTALAYRQNENTPAALDVLERALSLAEPEGFIRTFLDEGEPMAHLLYDAAAQGMCPVYIGRLLAAFSEENAGIPALKSTQVSSADLIEPLSERELEVLELIAKGLSNQEIAQRLHISLSTVKTHASQIYGKLNVHSRTQAVTRARSLGLIPFI